MAYIDGGVHVCVCSLRFAGGCGFVSDQQKQQCLGREVCSNAQQCSGSTHCIPRSIPEERLREIIELMENDSVIR